jgi:hypothetical protein
MSPSGELRLTIDHLFVGFGNQEEGDSNLEIRPSSAIPVHCEK